MKLQSETAHTVDIDGPIHYVEWPGPPGRTFVLVHGLGGSHLNWLLVAPRLAEQGRVLALDLPGFGRSPRAGRAATLEGHRRILAAFLDRFAGGPVILGGNSLGGLVGLLQAAAEPATIEGLVLSGAAFPWARGGVPNPIVAFGYQMYRLPILGDVAVRVRFRGLRPERMLSVGLGFLAHDPSRIPADVRRLHIELLARLARDDEAARAFAETARSLLRAIERPAGLRPAMDAVRCPVLVIHGRRDRFVPVAWARAAVRAHPSWRLRILPDVGHIAQLEAPDRWLAAVGSFLDDRLSASTGAD